MVFMVALMDIKATMNSFIKTIPIAALALFYSPNAGLSQAATVSSPHQFSPHQSSLVQSIAQTAPPEEPGTLDLPPPRQHLGGRGDSGICLVSPGLLEQENVIWSDRPLFLWKIMSEAVAMQRLEVLDDQDGKIMWDKPLAATDKSVVYAGQALQPGQYYQWRLTWTVRGTANSASYTFQVMDSDRRNSITSQLKASGASQEAIAIRQANVLLHQPEPLVSDALQILYTADTLSSATTQPNPGLGQYRL